MADLVESTKRARREEESDSDYSPEAKRVRSDLLFWLDDCNPEPDPDPPESQDLDFVIKSLENELSTSSSPTALQPSLSESQPDLGYLLEASDDELGLPPPPPPKADPNPNKVNEGESMAELVRVESDSSGIGEFWDFEDPVPCDPFELGIYEEYITTDYVPLDGLFEYSDVFPESLPAE